MAILLQTIYVGKWFWHFYVSKALSDVYIGVFLAPKNIFLAKKGNNICFIELFHHIGIGAYDVIG